MLVVLEVVPALFISLPGQFLRNRDPVPPVFPQQLNEPFLLIFLPLQQPLPFLIVLHELLVRMVLVRWLIQRVIRVTVWLIVLISNNGRMRRRDHYVLQVSGWILRISLQIVLQVYLDGAARVLCKAIE